MFLRLLPLFLLMFLTSVQGTCQTDTKTRVKVSISKDEDADSKILPIAMVPNGENGILMLRSGELFVRAFGSMSTKIDLYKKDKLSYVRSMEPALDKGGEKLLTEGLVWFGGKALFLARGMDDGATTIYWQELDPNLTKAPWPFQELVSWGRETKTGRANFVAAGSSAREPYGFQISPDSTKLLIHSPEQKRQEDKGATFLLAVVDKDLKPLWSHELDVEGRSKNTELLSITLDDQGVAFALVKLGFGNKEVKDGEANFEVRAYRIDAQGAERTEFALGGSDYIRSAGLRALADGRIGCAGIYGDADDKKKPTKGNFTAFIPQGGGSLENVKLYPFRPEDAEGEDLEDAEEGTKHEQRDADAMGSAMRVLDVLPCSDGGFFIVNERYMVVVSRDPNSGQTMTYYVHGTLLIRRIEASGEERWSTMFRRRTSYPGSYFGNVFSAEYNDELYLFLLDSEKAAEARKEGKKISSASMRAPHSAYVTFSETGKPKTKVILKRDKQEDFITGWDLVRLGPDEYVALGAEKLTKARFLPVKVSFSTESR